MQTGQADVAVGGYVIDWYYGPIPLNYERVTHTPTYMTVEYRWYSKLPARLSMVTNITRVFDPPTWLWTFIMAFVGFSFLLIITKKTKRNTQKRPVWKVDFCLIAK